MFVCLFDGISDSVHEGSDVSAEDELLNKHTFCYIVIEEAVLPKHFPLSHYFRNIF